MRHALPVCDGYVSPSSAVINRFSANFHRFSGIKKAIMTIAFFRKPLILWRRVAESNRPRWICNPHEVAWGVAYR
jgi:hypothetical protein